MVRRKFRPKDLIGRYGKMVRRKVRPKDLIGRYGRMVRRKVHPKDHLSVLAMLLVYVKHVD